MKVVPAAAVLVTVSPPVMALHNAPGNGQPQAVAAPAPVPGGVRPVETLEEVGQVLRRDGLAGVVYRQPQPLLVSLQGEGDGARPGPA